MGLVKPLVVKIPISNYCEVYLTPGKEYEVIGYWQDEKREDGFVIIDDHGDELRCLLYACPHLDFRNWEIVKAENL